jgi:hypothetical protein
MSAIFKSKRFWLAVGSAVTVVLKDYLPISEEQVQQIVLVVAAWIVGDSLRQTTPEKARFKSNVR